MPKKCHRDALIGLGASPHRPASVPSASLQVSEEGDALGRPGAKVTGTESREAFSLLVCIVTSCHGAQTCLRAPSPVSVPPVPGQPAPILDMSRIFRHGVCDGQIFTQKDQLSYRCCLVMCGHRADGPTSTMLRDWDVDLGPVDDTPPSLSGGWTSPSALYLVYGSSTLDRERGTGRSCSSFRPRPFLDLHALPRTIRHEAVWNQMAAG